MHCIQFFYTLGISASYKHLRLILSGGDGRVLSVPWVLLGGGLLTRNTLFTGTPRETLCLCWHASRKANELSKLTKVFLQLPTYLRAG